MVKKKVVWETKDGQTFADRNAAARHEKKVRVLDLLRRAWNVCGNWTELELELAEFFGRHLTPTQIFRLETLAIELEKTEADQ